MFKHILLATDGFAASENAAALAVGLARDAAFHALHGDSHMKTDLQLKADVMAELVRQPSICSGIGTMVKDGVVTLTGPFHTLAERHAAERAERAVRRIAGVRRIAIELDLPPAPEHKRSDPEIAQAAAIALRLNSKVLSPGKVQFAVQGGWVTLTGEVDWGYQFASAEQCIRPLAGVHGVFNRITTRPHASSDYAAQIGAA